MPQENKDAKDTTDAAEIKQALDAANAAIAAKDSEIATLKASLDEKEKKEKEDKKSDADAEGKAKDDKKAMDSAEEVKRLGAAMDEMKKNAPKVAILEVSKRNDLYSRVSPFVGAFDHSEMTAQELAEYSVKKLNIACDSGHELSVLNGFLAAAKKPDTLFHAKDSKDNAPNAIDSLFTAA